LIEYYLIHAQLQWLLYIALACISTVRYRIEMASPSWLSAHFLEPFSGISLSSCSLFMVGWLPNTIEIEVEN